MKDLLKFRKFIFYQELQELEKQSSTAEGKVNLGIRPCIIYSTELFRIKTRFVTLHSINSYGLNFH